MTDRRVAIFALFCFALFTPTASSQAKSFWDQFVEDAGKVVDTVDPWSDGPAEDGDSIGSARPEETKAPTSDSVSDGEAAEGGAPAEPLPPAAKPAESKEEQKAAPALRPKPSPEVKEVQRALAQLGYDPGSADGLIGSRTRSAISEYQSDIGLPVTGEVNESVIARLRNDIENAASPAPEATSVESQAQVQPQVAHDGAGVRSFMFRGVRLGDSLDAVAAAFPGMRVEAEKANNDVVVGYRGIWSSEDKRDVVRVSFTHEGRLYALNNGQALDPLAQQEELFQKIIEKYGPATVKDGNLAYQTEELEDDQAKFNVNIRSAADGIYVAVNLFDGKLAQQSEQAARAANLSAHNSPAKDLKL